MADLIVKPLDKRTWADFAQLVEKHNGVWGGCWCMAFHEEYLTVKDNRAAKEKRVRAGSAHAALVYDGRNAVGWCQFGPTEELLRIKLKTDYFSGLENLPDWRITCFFVDRDYRGQGVAAAALEGALAQISQLGGGTVESYPQEVKKGERVSGSFLYNSTLSLFEHLGFVRTRKLGKNHWVVTKIIKKSRAKNRSRHA